MKERNTIDEGGYLLSTRRSYRQTKPFYLYLPLTSPYRELLDRLVGQPEPLNEVKA